MFVSCNGLKMSSRRSVNAIIIPVLVYSRGWSGGAMLLGQLPVSGRPTIWITVGQGPTALAVGAGEVVWTFLLSLSFLTSFSLSLGDGPI